ncbi:MAG TPA: flagellar export chaperone FliS [Spirochaetia bacterium]|nr:flagellar export chaperone FliS [Spirochaetia bacterium]
MSLKANRVSAYKETSVRTASGGKMILMLYDAAIVQLDTAVGHLESGTKQLDLVNASILKAQDIITELTVSLDFDQGGEIAPKLFGLYRFFNEQLMEANLQKDPQPLRSVRTMMSELRGAWAQIVTTTNVQSRNATGVNIAG